LILGIRLLNLWLFYVLAYAIALPVQTWANNKRGAPFDDPEFLYADKKLFPIAMIWLIGGLLISLFVPIEFGTTFILGMFFYLIGLFIVIATFRSFANNRGLVTTGIHRYSRNPGYVGWSLVIFGMTLIGWSSSFWSIIFLIYFILTILYFHWTVLMEEEFLLNKYGDSYQTYLNNTSRYLSISQRGAGAK
jgi:protein-S-isoprenylcysteine O-methyltransferase Ste14